MGHHTRLRILLVATVYGISGQHERNLIDVLALASGIAESHAHFILIGDFNTSADGANEAVRSSNLRASVISFGSTYHAIEASSDIDFAVVSTSIMRAGIKAVKHKHEVTTLSKHDTIEIAIRYNAEDNAEYIAALDHKHSPETQMVYGPRSRTMSRTPLCNLALRSCGESTDSTNAATKRRRPTVTN